MLAQLGGELAGERILVGRRAPSTGPTPSRETQRGPRTDRAGGRSRRSGCSRRRCSSSAPTPTVNWAPPGTPQRLELAPDALEDLQHRGSPRGARELRADPRMRVDRLEHTDGDPADRFLRRGDGGDFAQRAGDDGVARGHEQLALVRDVPVDRAGAGRRAAWRARGRSARPPPRRRAARSPRRRSARVRARPHAVPTRASPLPWLHLDRTGTAFQLWNIVPGKAASPSGLQLQEEAR